MSDYCDNCNIMKIIKLLVFFILSIISASKAIAQTDHLEPANSIFDIYNSDLKYYSNVTNILFNGLTDRLEVRFLILPSFTPESVLDIEHDEKNSKYYLIYHICETMVWDNKNLKEIKVNKYKREISASSVHLIIDLFETAIQKAEYPKNKNISVDGINYFFSINSFELKTGKVCSPFPNTKMDRLVKIGDELINLAKKGNHPCNLDDKLRIEICNLTSELK